MQISVPKQFFDSTESVTSLSGAHKTLEKFSLSKVSLSEVLVIGGQWHFKNIK